MLSADATSEAVAATPVKVITDRYGFVISNAGAPGASTSASDNSPSMSKEATRVKKWQKMLGEISTDTQNVRLMMYIVVSKWL